MRNSKKLTAALELAESIGLKYSKLYRDSVYIELQDAGYTWRDGQWHKKRARRPRIVSYTGAAATAFVTAYHDALYGPTKPDNDG